MRRIFSAGFAVSAILALFIISSKLPLTVQALEPFEDATATQSGWDSSAFFDDESMIDYADLAADGEVQPGARHERTRPDNKPDLIDVECQSGEVSTQ